MLRQIEENLLLLLDPLGETPKESWKFVRNGNWLGWDTLDRRDHNYIYIFEKRQIVGYFIFLFWLFCKAPRNRIKRIIYVQHGVMSLMFPPYLDQEYQKFAKNHLSNNTTLRARIKSWLPRMLQAEQRFIVVRQAKVIKNQTEQHFLAKFEFMFFSNPTGKLLLTDRDTLQKRSGLVAKTTTNPTYINTLLKEASTVSKIGESALMKNRVPTVIRQIEAMGRHFVIEEYLGGTSLREILRNPGVYRNLILVKEYIDQLDNWFSNYRSIFSVDPQPISELYQPLFEACKEIYQNDQALMALVNDLQKELTDVSLGHPGLKPIIAHNDLWPGNFLVTSNGLVAIDWERASADRCEIFDYFWMIISTALEHIVAVTNTEDYSKAFRVFLSAKDNICIYANNKLIIHLKMLGITENLAPLFMRLFLLEWSIQGCLALGRKTAMDEIVQNEFKYCQESLVF